MTIVWNCHLSYILYLWWQQGKAAVLEITINEGLQLEQPSLDKEERL